MSFVRALLKPVMYPFRPMIGKIVENEINSIIRNGLRLTPIAETDPADIFIAGYPRSGNTWFQNLLTGVVYGLDPAFAPDTLIQELVPDVHQKPYYKRFQTPMFFKSHHLPRPEYKRVVYLLRDGRDVMVSFFHFNRALFGDKVDFMRMVTQGEYLIPCKWHRHVEEWMQNPYGAQLLILPYEKLKQNPVDELRKFCNFAGLDRSDDLLARAVAQSSFGIMRAKERASGWDNPSVPQGKFFVRRGEVGSFSDEMPPEILEAFMSDAANTLRKFGYI
jgi:hypothetical protein